MASKDNTTVIREHRRADNGGALVQAQDDSGISVQRNQCTGVFFASSYGLLACTPTNLPHHFDDRVHRCLRLILLYTVPALLRE